MCSRRLLGDDCANRVPIVSDTTNVSLANATSCNSCSACAANSDVWFEWRATCTGTATIEACDVSANGAALSVYRGEACGDQDTAPAAGACDAAPGGGCSQRASLAVEDGDALIIRVGLLAATSAEPGSIKVACATGPATTSAASQPTVALPLTEPARQPAGPDVALIAGVAGGVGALLVVAAVVALVLRSRRAKANDKAKSRYTSVPAPIVYDDVDAVRSVEL